MRAHDLFSERVRSRSSCRPSHVHLHAFDRWCFAARHQRVIFVPAGTVTYGVALLRRWRYYPLPRCWSPSGNRQRSAVSYAKRTTCHVVCRVPSKPSLWENPTAVAISTELTVPRHGQFALSFVIGATSRRAGVTPSTTAVCTMGAREGRHCPARRVSWCTSLRRTNPIVVVPAARVFPRSLHSSGCRWIIMSRAMLRSRP